MPPNAIAPQLTGRQRRFDTRASVTPDSSTCPLPADPRWHRDARPDEDALVVLRLRRSRFPSCRRLRGGRHCAGCLREVVGSAVPGEVTI